ncbi:MAG: thiamine pyrophosphate-binding protein, partial [Nitrospinaceae bacterium]
TSLNLIYKIPVLVIMSWRGEDSTDAPEHIIMGEINQNLLNTCGMEYSVISSDNYKASLNTAIQQMEKGLPYTLMVGKGYFNEGH